MRHAISNSILLVLLLVALSGCTGGNEPTVPPLNEVTPSPCELTQSTLGSDNHYIWSYSIVFVDPTKAPDIDIEIIPLRLTAAHWNVLTWLENDPCTDCLKVSIIGPTDYGTLLLEVEITHPWSNPNLTGFDVRGIVMFDASHTFPVSGLTVSDRSVGDGALVNADGYTSLYNFTTEGQGFDGLEGYFSGHLASPQPPDALLNGYKRHISNDPANTRNAFYVDDTVSVVYDIDMPDGPFIFGYAVDCSWVKADSIPVTDPINDFGPDANCPEAWSIEVTEDPDSPGLNEDGGETKLIIDVFDWQGKDEAYPVLVECPEIFTGSIVAEWIEDGDGFSRYEVTIENTNLACIGEYMCLIKKVAAENDPAGKPWLDLSAYQVFILEVDDNAFEFNFQDITPIWFKIYNVDFCKIHNDYVYMIMYDIYFLVFDVTDPSHPEWINYFHLPDRAVDMATDDNYVYVIYNNYYGDGGGLLIIDVSTPDEAFIAEDFSIEEETRGLSVWNGYAIVTTFDYVDDFENLIIDVDPPEETHIVNTFQTPAGVTAYSDGYAYSRFYDYFTGWSWLSIIDVDPPENPDGDGGFIDSFGNPYGFEVSNGLLGSARDGQIDLYDVDPPSDAYKIKTVDTPGSARGMAFGDDHLYVNASFSASVEGINNLQVIDINPPESASVVNSIITPYRYMTDIDISGNYLCLQNLYGFSLVDIQDPVDIQVVGGFDNMFESSGVAISGDYAFIVKKRTLHILDVDPPEEAWLVSTLNNPGWQTNSGNIAVADGYAYITYADNEDENCSLWIVDIDPPQSAHTVVTVDSLADSQGVAVFEGFAYIADMDAGLRVIDIDPPESAFLAHTVDTPGSAMQVTIADGYAYVADFDTAGGSGLQIIDISSPTSAIIINAVNTPVNYGAGYVDVSDGYAYVSSWWEEDHASILQIVDVTTPEDAQVVQIFDFSGKLHDVVISGEFAYLRRIPANLHVIDISTPEEAYIVDIDPYIPISGRMAVSGQYLYSVNNGGNFEIYQMW